MEKKFWHKAWSDKKIGFHLSEVNPALEQFGENLIQENKGNAFLPMCGKSLDLLWFSERVKHVYGVELSEVAILQFFQENCLDFFSHEDGDFKVFESGNITIYCGDFFELPLSELSIDIVYDRASVVALPFEMREKYYQKLSEELKDGSLWLLRVLDYPQDKMQGPPFSVTKFEITKYLENKFTIKSLEEKTTNAFGIEGFQEKTYLLER